MPIFHADWPIDMCIYACGEEHGDAVRHTQLASACLSHGRRAGTHSCTISGVQGVERGEVSYTTAWVRLSVLAMVEYGWGFGDSLSIFMTRWTISKVERAGLQIWRGVQGIGGIFGLRNGVR